MHSCQPFCFWRNVSAFIVAFHLSECNHTFLLFNTVTNASYSHCPCIIARVTNTKKFDRGLTLARRRDLHWLDVTDCVKYRLCVTVYKCLHGMAHST